MPVTLSKYGLTGPSETTMFRNLGKELRELMLSIEGALDRFDYNGADPSTVLSQVVALNGWIKSGAKIAASAAERATLFPNPAQGDAVYRTDLGWEERYYRAYSATTNPGGATPAGWYPVAGALPWATARKMNDQAVTAGDIVLNIAAVDLVGGFTFADNALVVPITGMYEVSANIYIWSTTGSYRGAQVVADSAMTVLTTATTSANWTIPAPKRRVMLTAGTKVRLRTSGDAAQTIRNEVTPSLHVSYIGPPR